MDALPWENWLKGASPEDRPDALLCAGLLAALPDGFVPGISGPKALAFWLSVPGPLRWGAAHQARWDSVLSGLTPRAATAEWQAMAGAADAAALARTGSRARWRIAILLPRGVDDAEASWRTVAELRANPSVAAAWIELGPDPDRPGWGRKSSWHWPVRVGVTDDASWALLEAEMSAMPPPWRRFLEVRRLGAGVETCDLLLVDGRRTGAWEALRELRARATALVVIEPPAPSLAPDVMARIGASIEASVVASVSPRWPVLPNLFEALSHDDPLDVALARAARAHDALRIVASFGLTPGPLLMAPTGFIWVGHDPFAATSVRSALRRRVARREPPREPAWEVEAGASSELATEAGGFRGDLDPTGVVSIASESVSSPGPMAEELAALTFDRERDGATLGLDLAERAERELPPEARYLHARGRYERASEGPATASLRVHVGPGRPRGSKLPPVPMKGLFEGRDEEILTIAVVVPGGLVQVDVDGPSAGRGAADPEGPDAASVPIRLPVRGASTSASFRIRMTDARPFWARVLVVHAGRILQSALATADPNGEIVLELETATLAVLDELEDRRRFDLACFVNRLPDGGRAVTGVAGDRVELRAFSTETEAAVERLLVAMESVATSGPAAVLDAEGTRALLVRLAGDGVLLRRAFIDAGLGPAFSGTAQRIQVIASKPEAVLPLELVYEGAAPDRNAPTCPQQPAALASGGCGTCPHRASGTHVCAGRFWGLHKVIERHAFDPASAPDRDTLHRDATLAGRRELRAPTSSLFARSDRAEATPVGADQVAALLTALGALSSTERVVGWDAWRTQVATRKPTLEVLLPHTDVDPDVGQEALEIGSGDLLPQPRIDETIVGATEPPEPVVVLLLGCDTAGAGVGFRKFPSQFRHAGAPIVVATLTPVLGRHAADVARRLVGRMAQAWQAEPGRWSIGDLMTGIRRELLAAGFPIGLALVAFGDADWRLG